MIQPSLKFHGRGLGLGLIISQLDLSALLTWSPVSSLTSDPSSAQLPKGSCNMLNPLPTTHILDNVETPSIGPYNLVMTCFTSLITYLPTPPCVSSIKLLSILSQVPLP